MEDLVYNIAKEDFKFPTEKELKKQSIKDIKVSSRIKIFKKKISITSLAELYGIEVKRNMACCPFHDDKIPSLSFSNQKGVFNCFGCGTKGDMITFVQKMEELKDGKKTS
ncbi:MAG: hypothetical protein CMF72_10265 [Mameliella sp.]|nr:hypothetical protein [Mameliella sp.]